MQAKAALKLKRGLARLGAKTLPEKIGRPA
jgi:hypothetical protein